ncbi:MAG: hypothetical protein WA913_00100 [Pricia sp.]
MRTTAIFTVFLFSIGMLFGQENTDMIQKGTVLTLGEVSASGYEHVDFPRKNFIIKRGAIANFNALHGEKVVVEDVLSKNGATEVVLERQNGRKFFRFWPTVTADLDQALKEGELKLPQSGKLEYLAR